MARQNTPKQMAAKLARLLRPERPDYGYLKKAFQHTRVLLEVKPKKNAKAPSGTAYRSGTGGVL